MPVGHGWGPVSGRPAARQVAGQARGAAGGEGRGGGERTSGGGRRQQEPRAAPSRERSAATGPAVPTPVRCRLEQSQPGSTRVVEESEGWFFLSGKATAVGGKHSPCYGLQLFPGGMVGSGRRVSASPGLASPSPGTSPPRAERAGRLP